jgi:hypothetical protein
MYMKKFFAASRQGVLTVLWAAALLTLNNCPLPLGDDWKTIDPVVANSPLITEYNLQAYVPIPVAGEKPVSRVKNRSDLEINVTWMNDYDEVEITEALLKDGFASGETYRAVITLTQKNVYFFDREIEFLYAPEAVVTQKSESPFHPGNRTILVVYKPARVGRDVLTEVDLSPYFPAPSIGAAPQKVLSLPVAPLFTGEVGWDPDEVFSAEQENYTATVTLRPAAGYGFAPKLRVTHSGITGERVEGEDDGNGTVTVAITFMVSIEASAFEPGSAVENSLSVMEALHENKDIYGVVITLAGNTIGAMGSHREPITGTIENSYLGAGTSPSRVVIKGGSGMEMHYVELTSNRPFLVVKAGMTVTLQNFDIKGYANNSHPVIRVEAGGTLFLNNVKIAGNINGNKPADFSARGRNTAGGIVVEGETTLKSGIIDSNAGVVGGVYVHSGGKFTMTDGIIENNTCLANIGGKGTGGVFIDENGEFVMKGDKSSIKNLPLDDCYRDVFVRGIFKMEDGNIGAKSDSLNPDIYAVAYADGYGTFIMSGGARVFNNYVWCPITVEGPLSGDGIVATFSKKLNDTTVLLGDFRDYLDRFKPEDGTIDADGRLSGAAP